ncbi:cytochrome P450 [Rhodococcoides yunnanense]|uniref:cytochrome P450 n=1 Tax=Rhodococcoides yunnanense TaxID=278209 RepID=UPI0009324305|nr:cytochrome P450 [Rhodococcus yunnanensis]
MTNTNICSSEPRTVSGSRFLGSTRDLVEDPLQFGLRSYEECGDVARAVYGPPGLRREMFVVNHPDGAAQALDAPTNRHYRKDNAAYRAMREVFGNGVATSQDETWLRQRRFIQPLFTPRNVDAYVTVMFEEINTLVARWRSGSDTAVDLRSEMSRMTLAIASRILFGQDSSRVVPVLRATLPVLGRTAIRRGVAPIPIPATWPTPSNRAAARAEHDLNAVCADIIDARKSVSPPNMDLIGGLIDARDDDGGALSDDEVRDQVKIFLLAGHDTTATALTFALHLLGRDHNAQNRLREESARVAGSEPPTAADVHALTYTMMVLKETTRLFPSAPYIGRKSSDETDMCGYRIPAGSDLSIAPWVIHHRSDLWPDPFRFDPDRFTPENEEYRHKLAWFPFGHGPRGCIGQRFAMLESALTLAVLAHNFTFDTPPGEVAVTTDLVLRPVGEVPCRIEART